MKFRLVCLAALIALYSCSIAGKCAADTSANFIKCCEEKWAFKEN